MTDFAQSQAQIVRESSFSDRLRLAMAGKANSLSLSNRLGISHSTVGRWLKGTSPSSDIVPRIASELSVNAQWLLSGEGPMDINVRATVREDPAAYSIRSPSSMMTDEELKMALIERANDLKGAKSRWEKLAAIENIQSFAAEIARRETRDGIDAWLTTTA